MKRILVTVILSVVTGGVAVAADLPAPPPPRAPAAYVPTVVPVYNWGGVYFGVNGGWGFGQSDWTTPAGASTGNFNISGGLVGATLGAQWQSDIWVGGVEGDFDGSWIKGADNICVPVACETHNDWLSTIRLRGGVAADRVLFYATAGGAFGDIRANVVGTTWNKETKAGWTAGAGIESAFAENWTARVEYLFVDLQNATFNQPPVTVKFSNTNLVRVGIDYKFR